MKANQLFSKRFLSTINTHKPRAQALHLLTYDIQTKDYLLSEHSNDISQLLGKHKSCYLMRDFPAPTDSVNTLIPFNNQEGKDEQIFGSKEYAILEMLKRSEQFDVMYGVKVLDQGTTMKEEVSKLKTSLKKLELRDSITVLIAENQGQLDQYLHQSDSEVMVQEGKVTARKAIHPNNKKLYLAFFGHMCLFIGLSMYNMSQIMILGGYHNKKQTLFN